MTSHGIPDAERCVCGVWSGGLVGGVCADCRDRMRREVLDSQPPLELLGEPQSHVTGQVVDGDLLPDGIPDTREPATQTTICRYCRRHIVRGEKDWVLPSGGEEADLCLERPGPLWTHLPPAAWFVADAAKGASPDPETCAADPSTQVDLDRGAKP